MLEDGLQIWRALKTDSGLDVRRGASPEKDGYDRPLELDVLASLYPGSPNPLEVELAENRIGPEDFLATFFEMVQPYALMLRDILGMFEAAHAKRGDQNLNISFNFDIAQPPLILTLAQFRDIEQTFRRITRRVRYRHWNINSMWLLWQAIYDAVPGGGAWDYSTPRIHHRGLRDWLSDYHDSIWSQLPTIPKLNDQYIDALIDLIEKMIESYIEACRAFGPKRSDLKSAFDRAGGYSGLRDDDANGREWSLLSLYRPDTDHWAHQIVTALTQFVERVGTLAPEPRSDALAHFISTVMPVVEAVPIQQRTQDELERSFREFITLPVWKRRSEVYAVWAGSRIMDALDDCERHYHPQGEILRFPFSGAHLATIVAEGPEFFHFWTELQTPLPIPVSGRRKRAIQPDYRLLRMPAGTPESTILVVECKQYRRSSSSNFSAALNDYAAGCPSASIVLVSYGPIGDAVLRRVAETYRRQTRTVERFRPDTPTSLALFRSLVRSAARRPTDAAPLPAATGCTVTLAWVAEGQDLDLHLIMRQRNGEQHHVYFGTRGSLDELPYVHLDSDQRSGPATEQITIAQWQDADYQVYVHNYSDSGSLTGASVTLALRRDGEDGPHSLVCTAPGAERWWYVYRIDGATQSIEAVDRLVPDSGRPDTMIGSRGLA